MYNFLVVSQGIQSVQTVQTSPEPLPETDISTNEKPRKIDTLTDWRQSDLYSEVALAKKQSRLALTFDEL